MQAKSHTCRPGWKRRQHVTVVELFPMVRRSAATSCATSLCSVQTAARHCAVCRQRRNVCALLERTFSLQCHHTPRRRSTHSIEGPCLFPRFLQVSLLCKALTRDKFPKTRAAENNLVDNFILWRTNPSYTDPPLSLLTIAKHGKHGVQELLYDFKKRNAGNDIWQWCGDVLHELQLSDRPNYALKYRTRDRATARCGRVTVMAAHHIQFCRVFVVLAYSQQHEQDTRDAMSCGKPSRAAQ